MSENNHLTGPTGFDAEFLSKRLGRVCTRLGLTQPFGDNHESNAAVSGTTLAAVDRAVESLVTQRDELLDALRHIAYMPCVSRESRSMSKFACAAIAGVKGEQ